MKTDMVAKARAVEYFMHELSAAQAHLKALIAEDHPNGKKYIQKDGEHIDILKTTVAALQSPVVDVEAIIDKMGWDEIRAFNAELAKGQSVYEDAGGYMIRCIKRLFGIVPKDEVLTYRDAAHAMINEFIPRAEKEGNL